MTQTKCVYVIATGVITAIGNSSDLVKAAIHAGVTNYQSSPYVIHRNKRAVTASVPNEALPSLVDELECVGLSSRQRRMLRLAAPALLDTLSKHADLKNITLFLAVSEDLPTGSQPIQSYFLSHLEKQTGAEFNKQYSRLFTTGRAGGIHAIDMAFKYLSATGDKYVLVGGIDTHADLMLIKFLEKEGRLLTEGVTDGFAHGEGAGFILLCNDSSLGNSEALGKLQSPGLASETGHRYSNLPYIGEGLDLAVKTSIKDKSAPIEHVFSSHNGESFGNKELGVMMTRNQKYFTDNITLQHPAEYFGDIGAAIAPVLITLAVQNNGGESSLICCSSDREHRGAIVVTAQ